MTLRPAPSLAQAATEQAASMLSDLVLRQMPLGERTTYRVGGKAALWVEPTSREDLVAISGAVASSSVDVLLLGQGSNLLVADSGWPGLVVHLGNAFGDLVIGQAEVTAGAALALPRMARRCGAAGRSGLEWAVGVPGSIGGAVRMNAGGHGSDVAASLVVAEIWDLASGECSWRSVDASDLGYRRSTLRPNEVVLAARLAVGEIDPVISERQIEEIVRWRREHQPGGRNAGSVFVNPSGDSAGRLVEAAGCKGLRIGSAMVSEKHANFIVADPGGSANDVAHLVKTVRFRVAEQCGIQLEIELHMVGFEPEAHPQLED